MRINMDRRQRLAIDTTAMEWQRSPAAGVLRKPLEREAAESGQVTSIVRYLPGARFDAHIHPLGEEILVLSGVFEDEYGRYPAGSYLRNPPGSRHTPASPEGCDLLVKLNMFDASDQQTLNRQTCDQPWQPGPAEGLSMMLLHRFGDVQTMLVKWAPGASPEPQLCSGGEEILVLEGAFEDERGVYRSGHWIRNPAGDRARRSSRRGCVIWMKTGHLPDPQ